MIRPEQIPLQVIHALVMNLDKPWPDAIAAAIRSLKNQNPDSAAGEDK